MSTGMLYHLLVRPIPPAVIALGVVAGVGTFALLGMARGGWSYGGGSGMNPLLYPSEFDVLFGNALELYRANVQGSLNDVPTALYFADVGALVPQQVAAFQKVDPAVWYVTTFYPVYAAQGGGLAFVYHGGSGFDGGLAECRGARCRLGAVFCRCTSALHPAYQQLLGRRLLRVDYDAQLPVLSCDDAPSSCPLRVPFCSCGPCRQNCSGGIEPRGATHTDVVEFRDGQGAPLSMCGIVGVAGEVRICRDVLIAMRDAMRHRGPDDEGCGGRPTAVSALGHRRLAIIDLSPAGASR